MGRGRPDAPPAGAESAPASGVPPASHGRTRKRPLTITAALFALAILLWLLTSFGSLNEEPGNSTSFLIGAFIGRAAISLLIAALARLLYVKLTKRGRFWSPWIFVLAACLTLPLVCAEAAERPELGITAGSLG